jgi:hypothetical protein
MGVAMARTTRREGHAGARRRGQPIGNRQPVGRRRSHRKLRTAAGWFLICGGLAIVAGLVVGSM